MDKVIERFQLDQFIECIELHPENVFDGESPDFVIKCKGEEIGIEITSIKQDKLSAIAGNQRKIVSNACRKAIQNGIPDINVSVFFHNYSSKSLMSNVQEYIKQASDFLYVTVVSNIDFIQLGAGYPVKLDVSGNKYGFGQISANWNTNNGHKWLTNHRWQLNEPGFVSGNFYAKIQNEINKKNSKFDVYKKKCNQCWLVIVVDRRKKDEHFDYSMMDKDHVYQSKYNKTYFFDLSERKAYLINTESELE